MAEESTIMYRVTEQVVTVVEVSYDVPVPAGADIDDIEKYADREAHEVHRETIRTQREIIGAERLDTA